MGKLKSAFLVSGAVVAAGAAGLGTVATTSATSASANQTGSANVSYKRGDGFDAALTTALAAKFNLNKTDVQSVINQVRQGQMQKHLDEKYTVLKKALSDGKISQAQYDHIVGVLKNVDTLRASLKDKSKSERMTVRKQIVSDLKDLASYVNNQKISWQSLGFPAHFVGRGMWHEKGGSTQ